MKHSLPVAKQICILALRGTTKMQPQQTAKRHVWVNKRTTNQQTDCHVSHSARLTKSKGILQFKSLAHRTWTKLRLKSKCCILILFLVLYNKSGCPCTVDHIWLFLYMYFMSWWTEDNVPEKLMLYLILFIHGPVSQKQFELPAYKQMENSSRVTFSPPFSNDCFSQIDKSFTPMHTAGHKYDICFDFVYETWQD